MTAKLSARNSAFGVRTPKTAARGAHADGSARAPSRRPIPVNHGMQRDLAGAHGDRSARALSDLEGSSAVAYIRVSTQRQTEKDGPVRQLQAITGAADQLGVKVVAKFSEAISGKVRLEADGEETRNREVLARCLDYCERNKIPVMLIEKSDRLARELVAQELAVQKFQKAGVRIISADGLQDLTRGDDSDPTVKLIRQIIGAVAEFDRNMISARLRAARERIRQQRGRCGGVARLGRDPEEQRAIKTIARMAGTARGSLARIAHELDTLGIRPRNGNRWSRSSVYLVVKRLRGDLEKGGSHGPT